MKLLNSNENPMEHRIDRFVIEMSKEYTTYLFGKKKICQAEMVIGISNALMSKIYRHFRSYSCYRQQNSHRY